jgi:hypothetical protein
VSPSAAPRADRRAGRRRPGALTSIALVAAVLFGLAGVGSPLLGRTVYAATDELTATSPYFDAGYAGTHVQNTQLDDTYTAEMPNEDLYAEGVRAGAAPGWNPYVSGGSPLGAVPSFALWSPLSLPYYLLPTWLAPGYSKLLEVACAIIGGYLFLRRIRLGAPAALLGGLAYASSGFLDMWVNFPQTRVASIIPWVFWAAERLVTRRRGVDVVLLSVAVGAMLLGGFPAVTAWALLTAGAYLVARALAEHRGERKRLAAVVAGGAAGLVGGLGLAAAQLLPFAGFYPHWLIEGRAQVSDAHLTPANLVTLFAPWAYGGAEPSATQPMWFLHDRNIIEGMSYLGAVALVLVVAAVALPRAGRTGLPRSVWVFFVAAAGSWVAVIYVDGPMALLKHVPVFSSNFVGRARSIMFFTLAVLAAIGFELVLRGRANTVRRRGRLAYGAAVWAAFGLLLLGLVHLGRQAAGRAGREATPVGVSAVRYTTHEMLIGLAVVAGAAAVVAWLYWRPPPGKEWVAGVLPLGVAVQALTLVVPFAPRIDRETFYPTTDVQTFLSAHLGHERFAGTWDAMPMGADIVHGLRAVTGHAFIEQHFAALLRGMPQDPIVFETYINLYARPDVAQSPILDRVGARYFVTSPRDPVFGTPSTDPGDGSSVTMAPGTTYTMHLNGARALRGVGVTPLADVPGENGAGSAVHVVVKDAAGTVIADNRKLTATIATLRPDIGTASVGLVAGQPFIVPLTETDASAAGPLTAEVTAQTAGPLTVAARAGAPALSTVVGGGDGLRLAHAGSAVVYERLNALPRIRWAARAIVQPDEHARVDLLASGRVGADAVVLDGPGATAQGRPAAVRVDEDGNDTVAATVTAEGAGYLVVADADQVGWRASVDGRPAPLVPADEGLVAVPVGAGSHRVTLHFSAPLGRLGEWTTITTLVILFAVLGWSWRRRSAV